MFNLRIFLALALVLPSISALSIPPATPPTLTRRANTCSANTEKLVEGINKNIDIQKDEQAQLKVLQKLVDGDNIDKGKFTTAQSKFVDIINQGITQRKENQGLAKGNPASDGLDTVAKAQETELKMAKALTGNKSTDDKIFSELSSMFTGGIEQNKKNSKAAGSGCTGSTGGAGGAGGTGSSTSSGSTTTGSSCPSADKPTSTKKPKKSNSG